ncbi:hypothetical protein FHL15_009903 [Xylaria flabelliformis]|uniref:Uncharacterized protein n=1 Tax=Xylaria flabelliformis TaxID=2512241 RepID=A0A553HMM3_9PEZI|nr:hypothetical protein FHL15_009903 [Xylaria flabelliformis]
MPTQNITLNLIFQTGTIPLVDRASKANQLKGSLTVGFVPVTRASNLELGNGFNSSRVTVPNTGMKNGGIDMPAQYQFKPSADAPDTASLTISFDDTKISRQNVLVQLTTIFRGVNWSGTVGLLFT